MSNWRPIGGVGSPRARRPIARPLRLATGLVLFTYATSHLINQAFGVHSITTFQTAGLFLLKPWQTLPGHLILYTAFVVHAGLGLYALYRRRHLRIPSDEFWQLALGITIPVLFIPHARMRGPVRATARQAQHNPDRNHRQRMAKKRAC